MSRSDIERLDDIAIAVAAVRMHLQRGPLTDGLVFDAVRVGLIEIGEAVKALPDSITGQQPDLPWRDIAQTRLHGPPLLRHRLRDHRQHCHPRPPPPGRRSQPTPHPHRQPGVATRRNVPGRRPDTTWSLAAIGERRRAVARQLTGSSLLDGAGLHRVHTHVRNYKVHAMSPLEGKVVTQYTEVIGLAAGRPVAVVVTFLLFSALVGGYLLGLIPYTAAGSIYLMLMLMLTAIGLVPAARTGRLTLLVNTMGVLELVVAWVTAFNRPIVVEWLTALLRPLTGH